VRENGFKPSHLFKIIKAKCNTGDEELNS